MSECGMSSEYQFAVLDGKTVESLLDLTAFGLAELAERSGHEIILDYTEERTSTLEALEVA